MVSAPSSTGHDYIAKSALPLFFDVNIGLVVDDVLDTSILREKFTQLIRSSVELGGLMKNKTDTRQFTPGSTIDFESRNLEADLKAFLPFSWAGRDKPTVLHDQILDTDNKFLFSTSTSSGPKPVSRLRATILNDASLLCFSFSHGLVDGQSGYNIIRYFCDLLSNKPIPRFILPPDTVGSRMSDLIQVPKTDEPEPTLQSPQTHGVFVSTRLGKVRAFAKLILEMARQSFGFSESLTPRLVHIPRTWIDEVRARAQKELESDEVQLTRNDIIAALYLKTLYRANGGGSGPVDFTGPIDYRGFLEPREDDTYYPHNSIVFLHCPLSEHEVQTESIAQVAKKIRLATTLFKHPAVVKRGVQFSEEKVVAPSLPQLRGGAKWSFPLVSPWTTFDYTGLDFSGASSQGGSPSVVFVNPYISLRNGESLLSPILITLKDGFGGYWLRGTNTTTGWEDFDRCTSIEALFS
ncbi:hypothetical protein BJX99DRAFT_265638 [Aspergillus californicus]